MLVPPSFVGPTIVSRLILFPPSTLPTFPPFPLWVPLAGDPDRILEILGKGLLKFQLGPINNHINFVSVPKAELAY
jgi:hypothetical protein